jgi:alpha-ketoglutarate-dependent taurine dioxygenase
MAPSATQTQTVSSIYPAIDKAKGEVARPWVKSTGVLNDYEQFDVTPVIGKEFPKANLVDWLNAPNADDLLRELALTISQRGVVFFRAQDNLTADLQKQIIQRIGELSGKPPTSKLHIHPILNPEREDFGGDDPEISSISSELNKRINKGVFDKRNYTKPTHSNDWHSDIGFEAKPADYSSLRLVQLPETGGDTLWASGTEIYDRISEPYQKFLETLTVTFEQPGFALAAKNGGFQMYDKERGAPENIGTELKAVHPVIRTNPVTGWKSVYPIGGHVARINDVTYEESAALLTWFHRLLVENHDLQVRFKWQNINDIAIWDNRSTFHTATLDFQGLGERFGVRAVSVGEKPFFDPQSQSRSEALAAARQ